MVAITATSYATPSAWQGRAQLAQVQRQADQAEDRAKQLRAQAEAAEREAQQDRGQVRTVRAQVDQATQADSTYDTQLRNQAAASGTRVLNQTLQAATAAQGQGIGSFINLSV